MLRTARNLLLLCALGACGAEPEVVDLAGTWAWKKDGGCAGAGERVLLTEDRVRWVGGDGADLGSAPLTVRSGFQARDRMQRWVELEFVRDGRHTLDVFTLTDRLGTPMLQLDARTVDGSVADADPRLRDRLVRCDG